MDGINLIRMKNIEPKLPDMIIRLRSFAVSAYLAGPFSMKVKSKNEIIVVNNFPLCLRQ
jgi:hypothetical protein